MAKNILKKTKNIHKILAIAISAVIVGGLIIFGFIWMQETGRADRALANGRIEIIKQEDIGRYFVFLPKERVTYLLQKSDAKFLFPQVDLAITEGSNLIIEKQEIIAGEVPFRFLTISGLPTGTRIRSAVGGFIRGGIVSSDINPYMWAKEVSGKEGDYNIALTYIPVLNIENIGTNNPSIVMELQEGVLSQIELGAHFATILTDSVLPENVAPGNANLAMTISGKDGNYAELSLQNILTYKGRIVMIEQTE